MTSTSARTRPLAALALVASITAAGLWVGGPAEAVPLCLPRPPIIGTGGPDVLYGTECDDVIWGRGGDDVIVGYGGDDRLHGQKGDDVIYGGTGADTLWGGAGADVLISSYYDLVPDATPDADATDTLRVEY